MNREEYEALFASLERFIKQEEERIYTLLCTTGVTYEQYITAEAQKDEAIRKERDNIQKRIAKAYKEALNFVSFILEQDSHIAEQNDDILYLWHKIMAFASNSEKIHLQINLGEENTDTPISKNEKEFLKTAKRGRIADKRTLLERMIDAEMRKGGSRTPQEAEFTAKRRFAKLRREFLALGKHEAQRQYDCILKYHENYRCFGDNMPTYEQLKGAFPNIAPKSTFNGQKRPKTAK